MDSPNEVKQGLPTANDEPRFVFRCRFCERTWAQNGAPDRHRAVKTDLAFCIGSGLETAYVREDLAGD